MVAGYRSPHPAVPVFDQGLPGSVVAKDGADHLDILRVDREDPVQGASRRTRTRNDLPGLSVPVFDEQPPVVQTTAQTSDGESAATPEKALFTALGLTLGITCQSV